MIVLEKCSFYQSQAETVGYSRKVQVLLETVVCKHKIYSWNFLHCSRLKYIVQDSYKQ